MSTPAPRASLPKLLLPAIPVALAGAPTAAHAVIVNFDIADPSVSAGGSKLYFDLTSGATSSSGSFVGADFYLKFLGSDATKPTIGNYSPVYHVNQIAISSPYVVRFSNGGLVDSSASWGSGVQALNNHSDTHSGNDGVWPADGTHGFIGLRVSSDSGANYNYGWAEVSYNVDQSFTLYQFAYESTANTGITISAAAVPEPATSAATAGLAALLSGSAAIYAKRRRKSDEPAAA